MKCEFKCSFLSQNWHYGFAHLKTIKHSSSAATHQYTHLCAKYDKYYNKILFLSFVYHTLYFTQKILCVRLCQIWYTFYVYQVHDKCLEMYYLFSKFQIIWGHGYMVIDMLCIYNSEEINLDFCFQLNILFNITWSTMQGIEQRFIYKRH